MRCGFSDSRALQFDHIHGNGAENRRKRRMSSSTLYRHILKVKGDGFQLLCANCNWIKRYENHEDNFRHDLSLADESYLLSLRNTLENLKK